MQDELPHVEAALRPFFIGTGKIDVAETAEMKRGKLSPWFVGRLDLVGRVVHGDGATWLWLTGTWRSGRLN